MDHPDDSFHLFPSPFEPDLDLDVLPSAEINDPAALDYFDGLLGGVNDSMDISGDQFGSDNLDLDREFDALPHDSFNLPSFVPPTNLNTAGFGPITQTSSANSSQPQTPTLQTASSTPKEALPPKIGTRFSKESLRILRSWLTAHGRHPFPTDEERESLQRQTGLTKVQILNWLANARRRGKIPEYQASPRTQSPSGKPIDIPQRPGTPAVNRQASSQMNPLERWFDSPPDSEPANPNAIARAMASGGPFGLGNTPAVDSDPLGGFNSTPGSSNGTSGSSDGSAYSYDSQNSAASVKLPRRHRLRRKTRAAKRRNDAKTSLQAPLNTFQCTFCTETFKTKHIWQRHEKSLHIALEKWLCAPQGPRIAKEDGTISCVYCDQVNPDNAHIESHNFTACQERSAAERTFHRKDHLGQHLRLVHNVKPEHLNWQLNAWKMDIPETRSRCGFCGIEMDTWSARVDHLAEHFKMGSTMAEWSGGWGFDPEVSNRISYSMPPYMIDHERHAPFPFSASNAPLESPPNAYELIKLELMYYIENRYDSSGRLPSADELHVEACRILFAADLPHINENKNANHGPHQPADSWLRDLIMSSDAIIQKARLAPLRINSECRLSHTGIIGKNDIFESCPLEAQLIKFVQIHGNAAILDVELQQEACQIILRMEKESVSMSDIATTWLVEMVKASTFWLHRFRQRISAPSPSPEPPFPTVPGVMGSSNLDVILQNYNILENNLAELVQNLLAHGVHPDDAHLRQMFLAAIDEIDDAEWKTAASNNDAWMRRFKRKHLPWTNLPWTVGAVGDVSFALGNPPTSYSPHPPGPQQLRQDENSGINTPDSGPTIPHPKRGYYFLNDPSFDRIVTRELARFVAATMSPHNPNQHVPTDEELRHQARWIMFEDGDPWNLTTADSDEWLRRFKRDVGILDNGPGLGTGEWYGGERDKTR